MIDNFSLGLTHALMLYVALRLLFMPEVDAEPPPQVEPERDNWAQGSKRDA